MSSQGAASATLRRAGQADIPILARHRRLMFEEMLAAQMVGYAAADVAQMAPAYETYLGQHLGAALQAWLAELNGRVAASGSVLLYAWPPRPGDSTGQAALLHSIYTETEFRRAGLARRLTQTMIAACRTAGIKTISLHASRAGQPLYESLGFHPTSEMRLTLQPSE
jgi:GNAT superfamily N-acetyltransferase